VLIKWTENAIKQLDRVHAFYAEIDPNLAARIFREIKKSPRRLSQFPTSGRKGQVAGTQELVVPGLPFLVVYRVTTERVEILRVLHTATDWQAAFQ
jgi:toxin ParE1/3/4